MPWGTIMGIGWVWPQQILGRLRSTLCWRLLSFKGLQSLSLQKSLQNMCVNVMVKCELSNGSEDSNRFSVKQPLLS